MIVFSGRLGVGALGSFQLARVAVGGTYIPHRGRATSRISAETASSSIRASSVAQSSIRATTARSEVSE